eukprot:scaffold32301_cov135-Isochrysis_galbana.AAC.10
MSRTHCTGVKSPSATARRPTPPHGLVRRASRLTCENPGDARRPASALPAPYPRLCVPAEGARPMPYTLGEMALEVGTPWRLERRRRCAQHAATAEHVGPLISNLKSRSAPVLQVPNHDRVERNPGGGGDRARKRRRLRRHAERAREAE